MLRFGRKSLVVDRYSLVAEATLSLNLVDSICEALVGGLTKMRGAWVEADKPVRSGGHFLVLIFFYSFLYQDKKGQEKLQVSINYRPQETYNTTFNTIPEI